MKILIFLFIAIVSFSSSGLAKVDGAEVISLVSPYATPPFVVDSQRQLGLIYELARILNSHAQGKYEFKVELIPRVRLAKHLERPQTVVVPLVVPAWFNDSAQEKFLWTSSLYEDESLLFSPASRAIATYDRKVLKGKKVGEVLGHRNPVIEQLVKNENVKREEVADLFSVLRMLAAGRIDFAISGRLISMPLINHLGLEKMIYVSSKPVEVLSRRVLISPRSRSDLKVWFEKEIRVLHSDKTWSKALKTYGSVDQLSLSPSLMNSSKDVATVAP